MSVPAPPGSDAFTITLSDASAHPLSTNSETVTIAAGQTTTAPPLVLGGIAATYAFTPATDAVTSAHVSSNSGGYNIIGNKPYTFTLSAIDASGATIIGPGTPTLSLTSPSNAVTVATISNQAGTFTVQTSAFSASPIMLSAHAVGGATSNVAITMTEEAWVGSNPNVFAFAVGTNTLTSLPGDIITRSNGSVATGLTTDNSGNLWVSDNNHTALLSFVPGSSTPSTTITASNGLLSPVGIATDAAGNIWVGIDGIGTSGTGAIQKVSGGALVANPLAALNENFPYLAFDTSGDLWIGSNTSPPTVSRYATTSATPLSTFNVTASSYIFGMAFDLNGHLWISNETATASAYDPVTHAVVATITGLQNQDAIAVDGRGNVWVLGGNVAKEFTATGQIEATITFPGSPSTFSLYFAP